MHIRSQFGAKRLRNPKNKPAPARKAEIDRVFSPSRELREEKTQSNSEKKIPNIEGAYKPFKAEQWLDTSKSGRIDESLGLSASKGSTRDMLDLAKGGTGMESLRHEEMEQQTNLDAEQEKISRAAEVRLASQERQLRLTSDERQAEQSVKALEQNSSSLGKAYSRTAAIFRRTLLQSYPRMGLGSSNQNFARQTRLQKLARKLGEKTDQSLEAWSAAKERTARATEGLDKIRTKKREHGDDLKRLDKNQNSLELNLKFGRGNLAQIQREKSKPQQARTILLKTLSSS